MSDPVEGVDYIFDRYAYLGLSPETSKDKIRRAITKLRATVHTDKLARVHDDLLAKAERIRELSDKCEAILLNDELRPLYDERLQDFKNNRPHLVSTSGTPIIDLEAEKFHLDFLLKGENVDLEDLRQQVQKMTGYNQKQTEVLQKLYNADSCEDNRDLLETALTAKYTYLCVMEGIAWSQAGIGNFKSQSSGHILEPAGYIERIETDIDTRRAQISDHVAERGSALRLGTAQPLLLLSYQRQEEQPHFLALTTLTPEVQAEVTKQAQKTFDARVSLIREIVAEKKEVLEQLLSVTFIEDLGLGFDQSQPYGLHLLKRDPLDTNASTALISFQVTGTNITDYQFGETRGKTATDLREAGIQGCIIYHNPEITDLLMPIFYAGTTFAEGRVSPLRPTPTVNAPLPNPDVN